MGEAQTQPNKGRQGRTAGLALCLACLYCVLSVFAALHSHSVDVSDFGPSAANCASRRLSAMDARASGETATIAPEPARSPLPALTAPDCPVCDFLAQPVASSETVPPDLWIPLVATAIPAPPVRAESYLPFRFCDRSASRAPPAASFFLS